MLSQVEKMMAQAELRTEDEDLKDEKSHDAKARVCSYDIDEHFCS